MKHYFTISEFADLRGININSLRYYEKIGVLTPRYIDKKTNYRYYSTEQLSILNQIILCTTIGIPLKELKDYIDQDGNLQSKELLIQGQLVALDKMNEIQNNLNMIEYMLDRIETNKNYENETGTYIRQIKERKIIISEYQCADLGEEEAVRRIGELYKHALADGLLPMLPAGQIIEITDNEVKHRLFLEITNRNINRQDIKVIPEGNYRCMKTNARPGKELFHIINSNSKMKNVQIIVDNIRLEKYSFDTRSSELQILQIEQCEKDKSITK